MPGYVSLDESKTHLGIELSNTDYDVILDSLIEAISDYLDIRLGRFDGRLRNHEEEVTFRLRKGRKVYSVGCTPVNGIIFARYVFHGVEKDDYDGYICTEKDYIEFAEEPIYSGEYDMRLRVNCGFFDQSGVPEIIKNFVLKVIEYEVSNNPQMRELSGNSNEKSYTIGKFKVDVDKTNENKTFDMRLKEIVGSGAGIGFDLIMSKYGVNFDFGCF